MSYKRFKQIKKHLRFDDPVRRNKRDALAPVRILVDQFNIVMNSIYAPGPFLCVDEMLMEFHGRVCFRQFIPTKPGKFGIKIFWVVDCHNSFPLLCLVYIGADTLSQEEKNSSTSLPEAIVRKLVKKYVGAGRCITGDNYFTSLALSEFLLQEKTTYVGTIRKNRRELPPVAKCTTGRKRGDTKHFYTEKATLCSFWDKGTSPVLLLSTMHSHQLPNTVEGKSDIVLFYNSTKPFVDNLDKLVRSFRSQRKCRRWPYGIFFTLADCAVIAALIMMREVNGNEGLTHYYFKRELAYQLCMPLIKKRAQLPRVSPNTNNAFISLGVERLRQNPKDGFVNVSNSKGRCSFCPREADKKSATICEACGKFVCSVHKSTVCRDCKGAQ